MNGAKDTPTVRDKIEEFKRLQRLTPQRLDRLEEDTALISRSVAHSGLVTNRTIAELDRRMGHGAVKRLYQRLEPILMIGATLLTMAFTFWLTDFLLTKLLNYLVARFS